MNQSVIRLACFTFIIQALNNYFPKRNASWKVYKDVRKQPSRTDNEHFELYCDTANFDLTSNPCIALSKLLICR